ncbi:MAG: glucosamine inositolphosphorylceramide transferase family protein [Thermomicrobiales bacterium]
MINVWRLPASAYIRLFRHDVWNIGIVDAPIQTFLTPGARPPVRWLPEPPRGSFLADPFMIETESGPVILAEGFTYAAGKGQIAALTATPGGEFGPPTPVIDEPVHLSYPFIVQHEGRIFCIPESGTARAVHCYEATAFPRHWERRATLIEGFAALDATIFRHQGRWWLLCSEQDGTPGATLHAWYAADLLGPWAPHAANPVKRDLRSSRPAGTPFVHDGQLYRPAQDSTRTYGGAVVINHVRRLTPTEFAEETVTTVAPYADGPYRYGLHTLSACGERTVIDGKRYRFIPHEFRRMLGKVVGRRSADGKRREWQRF